MSAAMTDRLIVLQGGGIVSDDVGRIPLFVTAECAAKFSSALAQLYASEGLDIYALSRTSAQIAEMLVANGLDEEAVYDFEATTTGPDDALRYAQELAERIAARRPPRPRQ
jgi:uncharacterized membrane protein